MFGKKNFESYLLSQWTKRGCELADGERMGVPIEELVEHSIQRNSNLESPYVDLWVAILDEFISWQISLLSIFYSERRGGPEFTAFDKSITMILIKIIGDSIALRHLILIGFDTSARTLLRSTAEYMELMVAILDEPLLAAEFIKSDTPESALKFWREHLSRGGIRKKMYAAWQKFFLTDENHDDAVWWANWGASANNLLSGMSHPSYAGGVFTAIPLKDKYIEENWLGVWGDKSSASVDTIYMYASFLFPILLLQHEFPFRDFEAWMGGGGVLYDETNEMHKHVKCGREILGSLILSLGKDTNVPHVFPETDMSIWQE